jgi:hypothetical protein
LIEWDHHHPPRNRSHVQSSRTPSSVENFSGSREKSANRSAGNSARVNALNFSIIKRTHK